MSRPPGPSDEAWASVARLAELGVMTSSLLHELRQPLFAAQALVELIGAGHPVDERWRRRMMEQLGHIEELVTHYGGMGRDDSIPGRFDLHQPVRRAVEMLRKRASQRRIVLEVDLAPVPAWVRARESGVRQMVVNLLQNAFDALEDRPQRRVWVRTRVEGAEVVLEVEDDGPGIPDAIRDQVFEPFVTTKPVGKGTGLGLFITRRLALEAGGDMGLERPDGGGTRAVIRLPLEGTREP